MRYSCIAVLFLLVSVMSSAGTVTIGTLKYDDSTNIITDLETGTSYLSWDDSRPFFGAGGYYGVDGYHIASQTEAYSFYNAAGGNAIDTIATHPDFTQYHTHTNSLLHWRVWGDAFETFFHSDEPNYLVGRLVLGNQQLALDDGGWESNFAFEFPGTTWLYVSDTSDLGAMNHLAANSVLSPVPVPAAAWLFGSALLGFAGWARGKNKKSDDV